MSGTCQAYSSVWHATFLSDIMCFARTKKRSKLKTRLDTMKIEIERENPSDRRKINLTIKRFFVSNSIFGIMFIYNVHTTVSKNYQETLTFKLTRARLCVRNSAIFRIVSINKNFNLKCQCLDKFFNTVYQMPPFIDLAH